MTILARRVTARSGVLHVVDNPHLSGGAQRVALGIISHIPDPQASVACPPGELSERVRALGIPVTPIALGDRREILHALPTLVGALRERRPALVHSHMPTASLLGEAAGALTGTPHLVSLHAEADLYSARYRAFLRLAARRGATLVAVSPAVSASLAAHGGFRAELIENAVDERAFELARRSDRMSLLPPSTVLATARLSPERGLADLVAAMVGVREAVADARLAIAGEGPSRDGLEALVQRLGLGDAVDLLGYRTDCIDLAASAAVCVVPAHRDPFGLAAREAIAVGAPTVISATGGLLELHRSLLERFGAEQVARWGIRMVAPGQIADLAQAVVDLLSWNRPGAPPQPAPPRTELDAYLRDRYSTSRMVDQYRSLYRLLESRSLRGARRRRRS